MKKILKYRLPNGKIPFDKWLQSIDKSQQAKVLIRLERMKNGLYGNSKKLPNELNELKFSSGERIYFYEENDVIVILLNAGNKKRQSDDIKTAEKYLLDYKLNNKEVTNEK